MLMAVVNARVRTHSHNLARVAESPADTEYYLQSICWVKLISHDDGFVLDSTVDLMNESRICQSVHWQKSLAYTARGGHEVYSQAIKRWLLGETCVAFRMLRGSNQFKTTDGGVEKDIMQTSELNASKPDAYKSHPP
jgi:hypothetical protein